MLHDRQGSVGLFGPFAYTIAAAGEGSTNRALGARPPSLTRTPAGA